jgi:hypothetical protein
MSLCSREQDVLILDTSREAPLFQSAGFSVALPETVLAAVSVKTKFGRNELSDAADALNSLLHVVHKSGGANTVWSGAFFFESPSPLNGPAVKDAISLVLEEVPAPARSLAHGQNASPMGVAAIAVSEDLLVNVQYTPELEAAFVGYNVGGLACALFLAQLMDHIATRRGAPEASMLSFADQLESYVLFNGQARLPTTRP